MLARVNRIVLGDDYKNIVRSGRRRACSVALIYLRPSTGTGEIRFGFIVAKTVGNAVQRNLVRRRLKSISSVWLNSLSEDEGSRPQVEHARSGLHSSLDIVVRALPGAAQASWTTLTGEITRILVEGVARA